jgi:hypothetical protein
MSVIQIPTASRLLKAANTGEVKFAPHDRVAGTSNPLNPAHSADGTLSERETSAICRANEVAVATIWLIFFALLVGGSVVARPLSDIINPAASY